MKRTIALILLMYNVFGKVALHLGISYRNYFADVCVFGKVVLHPYISDRTGFC